MESGIIASVIARIPDHLLRMTFAVLDSFGISKWCPDIINSTPTSFYNAALESIALETFELAVTRGAYDSLQPNLEYAESTGMLQKFYRNFVFHYLRGQMRKELREPGRVMSDNTKNTIYKRREKVCGV